MESVDPRVTLLMVEYTNRINSNNKKKTTQMFLDECQDMLTEYFKHAENTKNSLTNQSTNFDPVKNTKTKKQVENYNWNDFWNSDQYGGRHSFPDEYQRILNASGEKKLTHFQVLSSLRTELENEPDQIRWKNWWTTIQNQVNTASKQQPLPRKTKKQ